MTAYLRRLGTVLWPRYEYYCFVLQTCFSGSVHKLLFHTTYLNFHGIEYKCTRTQFVMQHRNCDYMSCLIARNFSSSVDDSDEDEFESDKELDDMPQCVYKKINPGSSQLLLYQNHDDPVVTQLCEATSVQQVFDILKSNASSTDEYRSCQAVLTLHYLQKIYCNTFYDNSCANHLHILLREYCEQLENHPSFRFMLTELSENLLNFSNDALACLLLYLVKIGIGIRKPEIQRIVQLCQMRLPTFELPALSVFLTALSTGYNRACPYIIACQTVAHIHDWIIKFQTASELILITNCLESIQNVISLKMANLYRKRLEESLDNLILEAKDVVKIVKLLFHLGYSTGNHYLLQKLLMHIKGRVTELHAKDIIVLTRVINNIKEPQELMDEICLHAGRIFEKCVTVQRVDLLKCMLSFAPVKYKNMLEHEIIRCIKEVQYTNNTRSLFKVLRYLKTADVSHYDMFWNTVLETLQSKTQVDLISVCSRYLFFKSYFGSSYNHSHFESQMAEWVLSELQGLAGFIPSSFAPLTAFIIAHSKGRVPGNIVKKIEDMAPQLSIPDLKILAKGIEVGMGSEEKQRNQNRHYLEQIVYISKVVNKYVIKHVKSADDSADVATLLISYCSLNIILDTHILDLILTKLKYTNAKMTLSSLAVTDISYSLTRSKHLDAFVVDNLAKYIIDNEKYVAGETVVKVLFTCFELGYTPLNNDQFGSAALHVINRCYDKIWAHQLLMAGLSLCFLRQMTSEIVQSIFSVEFLDQLDAELDAHYWKGFFLRRVQKYMMELNRAVCIGYPEEDVPWFHEKFCQEIAANSVTPNNPFHKEVYSTLAVLLEDPQYVRSNVYSPYYHKIDFEVILDSQNQPIFPADLGIPYKQEFDNVKEVLPPGAQKVAVLLFKPTACCSNVFHPRGLSQMKKEQLEMLGYKVVELYANKWNASHMTGHHAKLSYLTEQIFNKDTYS